MTSTRTSAILAQAGKLLDFTRPVAVTVIDGLCLSRRGRARAGRA
jgi:hypothetical protein